MNQGIGSGTSYTVERYFAAEGVLVTIPNQAVARALLISDPQAWPADAEDTPGVFELTRPVINFHVTENDGSTIVHHFNPPLVLRVEITEAELEQVAAGHDLKLGFWDGSRWVLFTKEKHHFQIHSQFALALIRHWGDPGVGWGR
jgi:hypothetical protein